LAGKGTEGEQEFRLEAAFCKWHFQMGKWPVSRMSPLLVERISSPPTADMHTQKGKRLHRNSSICAVLCCLRATQQKALCNSSAGVVSVAGKSVEWSCRES